MNSNAEFNTIAALDLDPIKLKLMHKQSGEGWSLQRANAVEVEYRRFLLLSKLYPNEQMAPLVDVDTFWHYHILDTMKYAADCDQAFGYFLHHFPYVGLGEDDEAAHEEVGARMKARYEATFGPMDVAQDGAQGASAWCSLNGQSAWCSLNGQAAWCSLNGQAARAVTEGATAWCSLGGQTAPAPNNGATAWCSLGGKLASTAIDSATAWCSLSGQTASTAIGGATAWCSLGGKPASTAIGGATAWCSLGGKTASTALAGATEWCSLGDKAAKSPGSGATAWCSLGGKTAISSITGKTAWCSLGGKAAWCSVTGRASAKATAPVVAGVASNSVRPPTNRPALAIAA